MHSECVNSEENVWQSVQTEHALTGKDLEEVFENMEIASLNAMYLLAREIPCVRSQSVLTKFVGLSLKQLEPKARP